MGGEVDLLVLRGRGGCGKEGGHLACAQARTPRSMAMSGVQTSLTGSANHCSRISQPAGNIEIEETFEVSRRRHRNAKIGIRKRCLAEFTGS